MKGIVVCSIVYNAFIKQYVVLMTHHIIARVLITHYKHIKYKIYFKKYIFS